MQAEEVEVAAADPAVHEAEADKKEADDIEEPAVAEPPAFFGAVAKLMREVTGRKLDRSPSEISAFWATFSAGRTAADIEEVLVWADGAVPHYPEALGGGGPGSLGIGGSS